jgi:hypothetical protein
MLLVDLYSLLPAFTLAAFLGILLWPENINYKSRLRLIAFILVLWIVASLFAMAGYGASEKPLVCLINVVVGFLGLTVLVLTYRIMPTRANDKNSK